MYSMMPQMWFFCINDEMRVCWGIIKRFFITQTLAKKKKRKSKQKEKKMRSESKLISSYTMFASRDTVLASCYTKQSNVILTVRVFKKYNKSKRHWKKIPYYI